MGFYLERRVQTESGRLVVANLNARVRSWWVMTALFALALASGGIGSVILFGLTSFVALREFITFTPTSRAHHRTLFWVFFVFVPFQYYLVATEWYGMFAIFIPVYAFLFIPVRSVLAGDTTDFLARTAKIQWGLMVAVYCISHAPALLMLQIPGYEGENAKLLLYLVVVVQLSDVLQYTFGKTLGYPSAAASNPSSGLVSDISFPWLRPRRSTDGSGLNTQGQVADLNLPGPEADQRRRARITSVCHSHQDLASCSLPWDRHTPLPPPIRFQKLRRLTTPAWSDGQNNGGSPWNGGSLWNGVSPTSQASSPSERAGPRLRIRSIRVCNVETGLSNAPGASGHVSDSWQHVKPGPS